MLESGQRLLNHFGAPTSCFTECILCQGLCNEGILAVTNVQFGIANLHLASLPVQTEKHLGSFLLAVP